MSYKALLNPLFWLLFMKYNPSLILNNRNLLEKLGILKVV
ncbi:MAG: hypothetical protein PME_34290 [Priestia megaterium]